MKHISAILISILILICVTLAVLIWQLLVWWEYRATHSLAYCITLISK